MSVNEVLELRQKLRVAETIGKDFSFRLNFERRRNKEKVKKLIKEINNEIIIISKLKKIPEDKKGWVVALTGIKGRIREIFNNP